MTKGVFCILPMCSPVHYRPQTMIYDIHPHHSCNCDLFSETNQFEKISIVILYMFEFYKVYLFVTIIDVFVSKKYVNFVATLQILDGSIKQ